MKVYHLALQIKSSILRVKNSQNTNRSDRICFRAPTNELFLLHAAKSLGLCQTNDFAADESLRSSCD